MAEPVKKAAARTTKKAVVEPSEAAASQPADHAQWLALQWLLPRAFPAGQWHHAPTVIEDAGLPQEVVDVLREAYNRASA